MDGLDLLGALAPGPPDWRVDWAAAERSRLNVYTSPMAGTPQNPDYHGEGDVWTHTKLACEALAALDGFRALPGDRRQAVFLAALLHDIGKVRATRLEDGRWTSPNHAAAGARLARQILWLDFGLCGTPEKQRLRETVCALIRYHAVPARAIDAEDGVRRLRAIAANGALLPGFTLRLLCLLAEADALGRVCADREDMRERVLLCCEMAREAGCLEGPYSFPTPGTRFAYLSGRNVPPDAPLYDGAWGPVIMLSGLPGTGKDTWIAANCPDLPQISLDAVRAELGISPLDNQSRTADAARERARELLRQKRPFVWNATDLSPALRQKQLSLFHAYGARTRIVYLEADWEELKKRNRGRTAAVPEDRIVHMLENMTPPEPAEAREVLWLCV